MPNLFIIRKINGFLWYDSARLYYFKIPEIVGGVGLKFLKRGGWF
ncbi:cell cycle protein [Streptococcus sanguinis SK355]|uniref:Cell cycle protein n=1 Tax=Streptococcus sanguinis SK355 TaxID=888816 RepID=F3UPH7_STRSA|nr:cell cycle protein [Streptococcus sanguinis SK355]